MSIVEVGSGSTPSLTTSASISPTFKVSGR